MSKVFRNLIKYRSYYTVSSTNYLEKNVEMQQKLAKQLQAKIRMTGPITISDYMKEVLTNPFGGYYMKKDVFGEKGDFITSPELCQIFGEIVGIWFMTEWEKIGSPKPFNLVELGPGRGTLCQDMLKVFKHFGGLNNMNVNLVEISPYLSDLQSRKLCLESKEVDNSLCYREGTTANGTKIFWYYRLEDVPREFSFYIAHEFFDALPIQKFQKTNNGWREILIDADENDVNKFKYVISKKETVGSRILIDENETRDHIEVSRDTISIVKHLASRIEEDGGIALIADYGHNGKGTDTFRAYKNHEQQDPLLNPGSADLTADVNFKLIKSLAEFEKKTIGFGPVTQKSFLESMGIKIRLEHLKENATPEQKEYLEYSVKMLTDEDKMGKRFKLLSLFPEVLTKHLTKFPVIGFSP